MPGFPPPPNFAAAGVSAGVDFGPGPVVGPCGLSIPIPRFKIGFIFPGFNIPFPPTFFLAFKLSCKLPNPLDVSAGVTIPFGGGRTPNAPPDPDLDETSF